MPAMSKTLSFNTDINTTGTVTVLTTTSVLSMPAYYHGNSTFNPPYNILTFPSNQEKGTGYYGISSGLHTVAYTVSPTFVGTLSMQATLSTAPTDTDWFDVPSTEQSYAYNPTNTTSTIATTFTGNFVWVRGKVQISQGTMISIQYNF